MKTRIAMIGCGAVGAIHAASWSGAHDVELASVYSPDAMSAASFASRYCIPKICDSIHSATRDADVAIICSPSDLHFDQARECLRAGLHTLIELPACGSAHEATELGCEADKNDVLVGCAHTARYLEPYARIQSAIEGGSIGEVQAISYVRYPQLRARTWTDNALRHHAVHAIDLVVQWCGGMEPVACIANPHGASPQSTSLLGRLPGGGPVSVTVSYEARLSRSSMEVIGARHSIDTDGFSYLRSDLKELHFAGEAQEAYEEAIRRQDSEFIGACRGANGYVPWTDTLALAQFIDRFQALSHPKS
jgi:predicted dehydrogenase